MLGKYGKENLDLLHQPIHQYWGDRAQIENIRIFERPFDMFELHLIIDSRFNALFRTNIRFSTFLFKLTATING